MDDINSLKKRVAKLEKANRELEGVFNAIEDLIFVTDKNNIIIKANNAFTSFLKSKPHDIIGKKCHELVHGTDKPWLRCPFEKTKEDKKVHTEEIDDPKTGLLLLVTTLPILSDKGEIEGAVHTAKDVTEYRRTAESLRESELKYRTIFESSADAIMLLAPGGRFSSCNATAVKLFRCKDNKELISKSSEDLSPEYQPDGQPSSIKAQEMTYLAMEKGSNFFEWTYRRLNGEEFYATVLLTRMELGGQAILQATIRDITEQILSEKKLARKLRDMEIFYKSAIDREMKIKELKKRVSQLEEKYKI